MQQVLMVDDDPSQLSIRELILRKAGIAAHIATTVDGALAVLKTIGDKIGLVITDHNLPGRNGVDFVRELRTMHPSLPVVVLTGMPGLEDEYSGMNVMLQTKPFPPREFISLVQQTLDEHQ